MEQKNVKIFYKPVDGGELKSLECVAKSDGFKIEPLEEPIDVKYDPAPVTERFSLSFDMTLNETLTKNLRKLFKMRIPRKKKKRFKTNMCKHGWDIKKLKFSYKRLNQDVDGR